MLALHEEIVRLDEEIELLREAQERARKIGLAAQASIILGGALLLVTLAGLVPMGPAGPILAIGGTLAGVALFGSNHRTQGDIALKIDACKARRNALIDRLDLSEASPACAAGSADSRRNPMQHAPRH